MVLRVLNLESTEGTAILCKRDLAFQIYAQCN